MAVPFKAMGLEDASGAAAGAGVVTAFGGPASILASAAGLQAASNTKLPDNIRILVFGLGIIFIASAM